MEVNNSYNLVPPSSVCYLPDCGVAGVKPAALQVVWKYGTYGCVQYIKHKKVLINVYLLHVYYIFSLFRLFLLLKKKPQ
jgi:hypothetical protein